MAFLKNKNENPFPWLKPKGYLHITRNIETKKNQRILIDKITNPKFIESYAFYPLIHSIIKERKYKKLKDSNIRKHSFWENKTLKKSNAKPRPLHYATHFDALIYGYYAHQIQNSYEYKLKLLPELSNCITAYRKIPINPFDSNSKGKSTIHFSKEVFDEIINIFKTSKSPVSVLAFDIKSFFSTIDHDHLESMLCKILDKEALPPDYKNVFNATTKFSYILLDDLRIKEKNNSSKSGFDEKKLHKIKTKFGFSAFFESPKDFRNQLKDKKIRIYTKPFIKLGHTVGIPQGLPNSAVFANVYMYDFDKKIYDELVLKHGVFYRRYSDDIILICKPSQITDIKEFIYKLIKENKLEPSKEKTEEFVFEELPYNKNGDKRLTSIKIKYDKNGNIIDKTQNSPLVYLGFEFRGYNTLIKSSNVSKFYRRMIYSVKRKIRRINKLLINDPKTPKAIFINQLKPMFLNYSLHKKEKKTRKTILRPNYKGEFDIVSYEKDPQYNSNFYSYLKRANGIFETDNFSHQFRKIKHTLMVAIKRRLKDL